MADFAQLCKEQSVIKFGVFQFAAGEPLVALSVLGNSLELLPG